MTCAAASGPWAPGRGPARRRSGRTSRLSPAPPGRAPRAPLPTSPRLDTPQLAPQRGLRVEPVGLRAGHEREQLAPEPLVRRRAGAVLAGRTRPGARRRREHLADDVSEAAAPGPGQDLLRAGERPLRVRDALEHRRALLLGLLDRVPLPVQVGRVGVREHVRVAPHELRREVGGDVVDGERVRLLARDARVEQHLQEQVAELLAHPGAVVGLDGVGELVRLLEEVPHERDVRLLAVPRAPARGVEAVHDGDDVAQRVGRGAGRAVVRRLVRVRGCRGLGGGHRLIVGSPGTRSPSVERAVAAGRARGRGPGRATTAWWGWRKRYDRQVSDSVTEPSAPTVAVRLPPLSQTTFPPPSRLTYLYWKVVPAGRSTRAVHTG